jgi:hypothetical protein
MKKYLLSVVVILAANFCFAQSEKFMKAMEPLVAAFDTTTNREELNVLSNSFQRIAEAEKTQWLPYYYAALSTINAAYTYAMDGSFGDKSADIDPLADKAELLLKKADELNNNNSEIWVGKKMLASLRMMANPMARFQQYAPIAAEALETAKKLNAENPRVYILEGQDLYFTPEQFGGDKAEAKRRFETALEKFRVIRPENSIVPNWGLRSVNYFLSLMK